MEREGRALSHHWLISGHRLAPWRPWCARIWFGSLAHPSADSLLACGNIAATAPAQWRHGGPGHSRGVPVRTTQRTFTHLTSVLWQWELVAAVSAASVTAGPR